MPDNRECWNTLPTEGYSRAKTGSVLPPYPHVSGVNGESDQSVDETVNRRADTALGRYAEIEYPGCDFVPKIVSCNPV